MTSSSEIPGKDIKAIPERQDEARSGKKMTLPQIFSRSWDIYKANPIIVVPSLIPIIWLFAGSMFMIAGFVGTAAFFGDISAFLATSLAGGIALFIIVLIVLFIVAEGITIEMVREAFLGKPASLGQAWSSSKSRMEPLILASLISGIIITIGYVFLVIPGLILTFLLYFVAQAVMIEGKGAVEALGTSYRFVMANLEDAVIIILISMAIGLGLPTIPLIGPILSLLSLPYIYSLSTLLYMDRCAAGNLT